MQRRPPFPPWCPQVWLASTLALALGCQSGSPSRTDGAAPQPPIGPIQYRVPPPPGKVPYPQHDPAFDAASHGRMMDNLFIINNFGMYQGAWDGTGLMYLHDGLDFVLPNGTPIFAVQGGTVVTLDQRTPYYNTLLIEDEADPTRAWEYAHVSGFTVRVGDRVAQGQRLASVSFRGVEHIHLNRKVRSPEATWTRGPAYLIDAQDLFEIPDTEPPTLEPTLHILPEGASRAHPEGTPARGRVHLVTGIRDGGEKAHGSLGTIPAFGDRLAPRRVRMSLGAPGGPPLLSRDTDLSRLRLSLGSQDHSRALTLRLFAPPSCTQPTPSTDYNRVFLHFVLTQLPTLKDPVPLEQSTPGAAWDTAALNPDGSPQFPDGRYEVTVEAWDAAGNASRRVHAVEVRNAGSR